MEDLLIAVVASETPERKSGLGDWCDDDNDCEIGLACDPETDTCVTEDGIVLMCNDSSSSAQNVPRMVTVLPVLSAVPMESVQNR